MVEARITCTCPHIIIADLGLNLTRGDIVYLDEDTARKSQDLIRVARVNGVAVQYVQRAREVRNPAVGKPRRGPIVVVPRPVAPEILPTVHVTPVVAPRSFVPAPVTVEPEMDIDSKIDEIFDEVDTKPKPKSKRANRTIED